MKNPLACDACSGFGLLFARLPLGVSLAYTGINKIRAGVETFVANSSSHVPSYMPPRVGDLYLHAVPFAETALGILIVLGLFTRFSGLLSALMLSSFALAVTGFLNSAGPLPLQTPVVFACLGLVVLFAGPGSISLDRAFFGRSRAACAT